MKLILENWREYLTEQVYRAGMKDPDPASKRGPIAQLQQKLMALKLLPPDSDDGAYGPKTRAAVYKFQQKAFPENKKEWDGVVGENTLTKLGIAKTAAPQKASGARPTPPLAGRRSARPLAVIIGDSHVDWSSFGKDLAKELEAKGYEVRRHGVGGSAAPSWLSKRSRLLKQLQQLKPDLLLVSLGTNDMANSKKGCSKKRDKEKCLHAAGRRNAARIGAVAGRVKAKKTIWIGPPSLRGSTKGMRRWYHPAAADAIYAAGQPSGVDVVFDSRPSTKGAGKDGIHPTGGLGRAWAAAVVSAL